MKKNQKTQDRVGVAMSLLKHKVRWNKCRRCSDLVCSRHKVISYVAPDEFKAPYTEADGYDQTYVDMLFVGEAPGKDEDTIGEPFIGRSGSLLRDIIRQSHRRIQSNKKKMYNNQYLYSVGFTNTVCCLPLDDRQNIRQPTREEMINCSEKLLELINLVSPQVVIAVGSIAYNNLVRLSSHPSYLINPTITSTEILLEQIEHPANILRKIPPKRKAPTNRIVLKLVELADNLIPF